MNNEPQNVLPEETTNGETVEVTDGESAKSSGGFLAKAFDIVEMLTVSVLAVLLLFTFVVRLCQVDGNSMNKTLLDKERLLTTNLFYEPKQGDIVVFHLSNEYYQQPLVKRVIATEGQTVKLNFITGVLEVDGEVLDETYIFVDTGYYVLKSEFDRYYIHQDENGDAVFEAKVPEGHLFVMGDNRNHSTDSRSHLVGFVDKDCILGKAVVRISPFTIFD